MESTIFLSYTHPQRFQPFSQYQPDMYAPVIPSPHIAAQYSSVRSSAQGQAQSSQQYYGNNFGHQSPIEGYQDDSSSSSSSNSAAVSHEMSLPEQQQEYAEPHYGFSTSAAPTSYPQQVPRSLWEKAQLYSDYSSPNFDPHGASQGRFPDSSLYTPGYFDGVQKVGAYPTPELAPFYGGQEAVLEEPALTAYTAQESTLPSVVYSSPRLNAQAIPQEHTGSSSSVYGMSSPTLQYPPTPEDGVPPRFVNMQDISPSPTVSPDQVYTSLPVHDPLGYEHTLSQSPYVAGDSSPVSVDYEESQSEMVSPADSARRSPTTGGQSRKRRRVKNEEDEESRSTGTVDSGESEREEDADDADDDDDYTPDAKENSRGARRRSSLRQSVANSNRSFSPVEPQKPRLAPPVPVPNLTKKSRGRRVPTNPVVVSQNGIEKNVRNYKCRVSGCNKCFQRGEHLKRHVRSIHTNEKPHKCPYKNCGKDFSRHDNLRQHMRVHRNDSLDSVDSAGSA